MSIADRVRAEIGAGRPAFPKLLPIVDPEGVPGDEFLEEVRGILASKQLTNGAYVRKFEEAAAGYLGVAHCVAVSSCTAGRILCAGLASYAIPGLFISNHKGHGQGCSTGKHPGDQQQAH